MIRHEVRIAEDSGCVEVSVGGKKSPLLLTAGRTFRQTQRLPGCYIRPH